jgi:hypothetical protein
MFVQIDLRVDSINVGVTGLDFRRCPALRYPWYGNHRQRSDYEHHNKQFYQGNAFGHFLSFHITAGFE